MDLQLHGGHARAGRSRREAETWSTVEAHHWACLDCCCGADYHRLIVEYETVDGTITLVVPSGEVGSSALDDRLVTLEVLDQYLSPVADHLVLAGRAEFGTRSSTTPGRGQQSARMVTFTPTWTTCGDY
jgi:hypothetical protein